MYSRAVHPIVHLFVLSVYNSLKPAMRLRYARSHITDDIIQIIKVGTTILNDYDVLYYIN